MTHTHTRIAFVSCSAAKSPEFSAAADERYRSQLFRARREYCELNGLQWFVLSAWFGLLKSAQMVRDYEATMTSKSRIDLVAWHIAVVKELVDQLPDSADPRAITIELHAGRRYCHPLKAILEAVGFTVELPVQSLGIGQQLAFYATKNAQLSRASPAASGLQN